LPGGRAQISAKVAGCGTCAEIFARVVCTDLSEGQEGMRLFAGQLVGSRHEE
jgi:hypothetical protein